MVDVLIDPHAGGGDLNSEFDRAGHWMELGLNQQTNPRIHKRQATRRMR
jgi:hypothetical protein